MKTSSNYGLKLMEGTDNVRRQDFVDNFTKIDTEMRAIENGGYPIVEATGTNTYIGATARIKSLGKGTKLTLFVGTNATGNCSLNLNSYGAKNIKDSNGNIVTNIKANIPYNLCYNGSDFILQGKGGGGNLIPKYLLAGYYGEGDNGRVDGAMVNRGAPTTALNCGGTYNLQEGYYSGGIVKANSLASQTSATADASKILKGYTAWVNGVEVNGNATLQSLGGKQYYETTLTNAIYISSDKQSLCVNISLPFTPSALSITWYSGKIAWCPNMTSWANSLDKSSAYGFISYLKSTGYTKKGEIGTVITNIRYDSEINKTSEAISASQAVKLVIGNSDSFTGFAPNKSYFTSIESSYVKISAWS